MRRRTFILASAAAVLAPASAMALPRNMKQVHIIGNRATLILVPDAKGRLAPSLETALDELGPVTPVDPHGGEPRITFRLVDQEGRPWLNLDPPDPLFASATLVVLRRRTEIADRAVDLRLSQWRSSNGITYDSIRARMDHRQSLLRSLAYAWASLHVA